MSKCVKRRVILFLFLAAIYNELRNQNKRSFFIIMDFLKILKVLTQANDLELSDICVMAVLTTYAQYDDDQTTEMSYKEIQDEFKRLSKSTIIRSIKRLAANGYISVSKNGTQKNTYKVLIDIPKPQEKPIYQKKNSNKLQSEEEYIEEVKRAALANPFLKGD